MNVSLPGLFLFIKNTGAPSGGVALGRSADRLGASSGAAWHPMNTNAQEWFGRELGNSSKPHPFRNAGLEKSLDGVSTLEAKIDRQDRFAGDEMRKRKQ